PVRRFAAVLTDCDARLGADRIATPSSYRTCTDCSLPVSRRTAKDSDRQGLNSALSGEGPSLDILAHFTEISAGYSPMWDVQLAVWTKDAIAKGQRTIIKDGDDLEEKSASGLLVSPAGGPVRTRGNLVNCPVVGFTNE